jgi:hypothetical protein
VVLTERIKASIEIAPRAATFFGRVMDGLAEAEVPFMIGGAFAFEVYTDIGGRTKDLDLFLRPQDVETALRVMDRGGYETELTSPHWLAKVRHNGRFVDLIFSSGNGVARVDDAWFTHARPAEVLGREVWLIPIEEMLWSRAFIMERERYDGADVAHLIRVAGRTLDWRRLLDRFDTHWRVLLAHVILFEFAFPTERDRVPEWVRAELLSRAGDPPPDRDATAEQVCFGTLLSHMQYLPDVEGWGFRDARVHPLGTLTREQVSEEADRLRREQA